MNPSTEDILKAIEEVNADKVVLLPNNKNIFMAAEQAAEVAEIPVAVVPSRTIPQGMTAMLAFNEQQDLDENKANMTAALAGVVSGSVTHAIRDTSIDGVTITEGDFIGMVDGKIIYSEKDRLQTAIDTLTAMVEEDTEIVTIIVGDEADEKEAQKIADALVATHSDLEIEIHNGNQPVYPYLFAAE